MKKIIFALTIAAMGTFLYSCAKFDTNITPESDQLNLPAQAYNYAVPLPDDFTGFVNSGDVFIDFIGSGFVNAANPTVTNDGATLGRVLFYDKKMSLNNTISCGSCHHQQQGFADGKKVSQGFEGKLTKRNSMSIVNPVLNHNLFWDSRASSVPSLVLQPVQNHIEMGMESLTMLEQKLANTSYYPELFQKAYGSPEVTTERISNALSQFLCSLVSHDSKFDQGKNNNFGNFTPLEKLGKELFESDRAKCNQCHSGPNMSAPDFQGGGYSAPEVKGTANIGLDVNYADNGKGQGQFKIPSLRNIALTAPYMHDGRFNTLEEVVNHYNSNIQPHNNLDGKFKDNNGTPLRMNLNETEKRALVAFLNTLTDENFVKDPKFSNPFKQ